MNRLLLRRLRRSLMRTKLRVLTVAALITLALYTGVMMGEHSLNGERVYDDFYSQTNLADLIVENDVTAKDNLTSLCRDNWTCSTSLVLGGQAKHVNETHSLWIQSEWVGMDGDEVNKLYSIEGSTTPGYGEVVVDAHAAVGLSLELGDEIGIIAGEGLYFAEIVGIANHPEYLWYAQEGSLFPTNDGYVVGYLSADYLSEIANLSSDSRNHLNIDLEGTPAFDFSDTGDVDEGPWLTELAGDLQSEMYEQGLEGTVSHRGQMSSPELLRLDLDGNKKSTPFILTILLLISGLVIAVSIDRLVKSQAREIAVLRTLGASGKEIMSGYMLIPLIIGIPSIILGLALGVSPIGSEFMTKFYFDFLGIPVVQIHHYPELLAQMALAAVVLTFLFGIRPAIRAAKLQPLEVLGQGEDDEPNKLLISLTSFLPPAPGLAIRSTFRKPGRLFVTLLALALSMTILGGTMMMMASFEGLMDQTMDEQENWDIHAYYWPFNQADVEGWAVNNSQQYELLLEGSATMKDDTRQFKIQGLDQIVTDDSAMHKFGLLDGELPQKGASTPEVLIDEGMASQLDLGPGDTATISHGSNDHEVVITGVVREMERLMVFHRDDYSQIAGYEANAIRMTLAEGSELDEDFRGQTAMVMEKAVLVEGFESLMKQQETMMQTTYLIGAIMAIAILLNTLLMNLAERDSELATLRVLGASSSRLAIILTIEHAFIGLIGGLAGVGASIAMLSGLATTFSTWQFHLPVMIDLTASVKVLAFVFFASLATTPLGMWRIHKMDLLDVVARHER